MYIETVTGFGEEHLKFLSDDDLWKVKHWLNDQTCEICLSSKLFDRLATLFDLSNTFHCVRQKMFLNFFKNITQQILLTFASQAVFIVWSPFNTACQTFLLLLSNFNNLQHFGN